MALDPIHGVFQVDIKKIIWFAVKDTPVTFTLSIHLMTGGQGQSIRIHKLLCCGQGTEDLVLAEDDARLVQRSITLDPAKSIAPGVLAMCKDSDHPPFRIALVCTRRKGDGEVKRETSFVDLTRCTPGSVTLIKAEMSNRNAFFHTRWGEVTLFLRWHTLQDAVAHRLLQLRRLLADGAHSNLYPQSWALASAVVPRQGAEVPLTDDVLKKLNALHRSLVGLSRDTFALAYREQLAFERGAPRDETVNPLCLWAVKEEVFMQQCHDVAAVCGTKQRVTPAMKAAAIGELHNKSETTLTSMLERTCALNDVVANIGNSDVLSGVLGDVLQRFLPTIGEALQAIPFCGAIAVMLASLAAAAQSRRDMMDRMGHVARRIERVYGMLAVPGVPQLMRAHASRIAMLRDLIKTMERCRIIIVEFDRANVLQQLFGNSDTAQLFEQEEKGLDLLLADLTRDVMVVAIAQNAGVVQQPAFPQAPFVSPREKQPKIAQGGVDDMEVGSPLNFVRLHDGVLVEWNETENRGYIVGPVHHGIAHHTSVPNRQVFDPEALQKRNGAMPVMGTKVQFLCGKGPDGCLVAKHVTFTDGGPLPQLKIVPAAVGAAGGCNNDVGLLPVMLHALEAKGPQNGDHQAEDILVDNGVERCEGPFVDAQEDSQRDAQPPQQPVAPPQVVDSSILGTVTTWAPGVKYGFITADPVGGRQRGPLPADVANSKGIFAHCSNVDPQLQEQLHRTGTLVGVEVVFDWRPSKKNPAMFEATNCRVRSPPPPPLNPMPVVAAAAPAPPPPPPVAVGPRQQTYELVGRVLSWNYCAFDVKKSCGTLRPGDDASRPPLSFTWRELANDPLVQPVVGALVLYSHPEFGQGKEGKVSTVRIWS